MNIAPPNMRPPPIAIETLEKTRNENTFLQMQMQTYN